MVASEGGANPGWVWFVNLWTSTFFRRCTAFKAQTRHGSVFQAAEVVMKAGRGQSGISVLGEGGGVRGADEASSTDASVLTVALLQLTKQQMQNIWEIFRNIEGSCSPVMHHCADTHQ